MATVSYIPASDRVAIRAKKIYAIFAVGHEKKPWLQTHTNHWCLYLQTSEATSVRIDMIPGYSAAGPNLGGWKGIIVVSDLNYLYSNQSQSANTVRIIDGLYVSHILDAITEAGRDKYEFDRDGVGCRKWTTDILNLLTGKGWTTASDAEAAKANITKLWPDGTDLTLDAGAYYT
jgi:hypothetical protein